MKRPAAVRAAVAQTTKRHCSQKLSDYAAVEAASIAKAKEGVLGKLCYISKCDLALHCRVDGEAHHQSMPNESTLAAELERQIHSSAGTVETNLESSRIV